MKFVRQFLTSERPYSLLAGFAAGFYPILFYYSNNYGLVNSWDHLWFFLINFLGVPVLGCFVGYRLFALGPLKRWRHLVVPFVNMFAFLFLLKVCLYAGLQKKISLAILVFAVLYAWFLWKHYKKVVIFQLLLALTGIYTFNNTLISQSRFTREWMTQPDDIESVQLVKKPNIYVIQPDGYVNFSEIGSGEYNYDNSAFKSYLIDRGFTNYDDFRSNYASTLSSNSSALVMKHHFYNKGTSFSEGINARNVIMGDNPVLDILGNNGYERFFLGEKPYLLLNRPKLAFDYSNYKYEDIPYLSSGLRINRELLSEFEETVQMEWNAPRFYFMEMLNPGHIPNQTAQSDGPEQNRLNWLSSLEYANEKLETLIDRIIEVDPDAMIVILADHGGYVGLNISSDSTIKTQDRDLIHSMFSAQLSIRWPGGAAPQFDDRFKTSVNVFRVLFSYLSEDQKYLQHLQPDESYMIIYQGAPKGVYTLLDGAGEVRFQKIELFTY